jgi:hypothetical protein
LSSEANAAVSPTACEGHIAQRGADIEEEAMEHGVVKFQYAQMREHVSLSMGETR